MATGAALSLHTNWYLVLRRLVTAGGCWPLLVLDEGTLHKKRAFIPGPLSICWEPGPCLSPLWELGRADWDGLGCEELSRHGRAGTDYGVRPVR